MLFLGSYNTHTHAQKHIMGVLTTSMFQNSIILTQIERLLVLRKTNKIDHQTMHISLDK